MPGVRIWSLHPRYLDRPGLTAGWREGLLAQAVIAGRTRGYKHHSQLVRLREQPEPLAATAAYLHGLADDAEQRGYRFDRTLVEWPGEASTVPRIEVTDGQLMVEWWHLMAKLRARAPEAAAAVAAVTADGGLPEVHPLFTVVAGPVAAWERSAAGPG